MSVYRRIRRLVSARARAEQWARQSHPFDTAVTLDGVRVVVGKCSYGVANIALAHHRDAPPLTIGRFCSIAGNESCAGPEEEQECSDDPEHVDGTNRDQRLTERGVRRALAGREVVRLLIGCFVVRLLTKIVGDGPLVLLQGRVASV